MPTFYIESLDNLLLSIRSGTNAEIYSGRVFVYGLIISLAIALILFPFHVSTFYEVIIPVGLFFVIQLSAFLILVMIADNRARQFEYYFPDALSLIAANLRAGMTLDKSILSAARSEFGPLEDELHEIGKDIVGGVPIDKALLDMGKRVRSEVIKQTTKLVTEGIKSGGALESLLSEIANDMRSTELIKEDVKANLTMYILFIVFAACVAAPIVYGISEKFVEISLKLQSPSTLGITDLPINIPLKSGLINVTHSQINLFYFSIIVIITIFASLLNGLLTGGNIKYGLRRIPVFVLIGISTFVLSKLLLDSIFLL